MSREIPSLDSIATNPRKKRPAILSEHRQTDRILDFSSEAMPRILPFYTVAMDHDNTAKRRLVGDKSTAMQADVLLEFEFSAAMVSKERLLLRVL